MTRGDASRAIQLLTYKPEEWTPRNDTLGGAGRCQEKPVNFASAACNHIMIRGINRMTIFNDDADNLNFLHILDFCADENFIIMAYA